MTRMRALCLTMVMSLAAVAPASAQIAWDGTMLMAPGSPGGLGIFLADPGGGDFAVEGMWRRAAAPVGIGVRAGVGEDAVDDIAVFGGVDISGTVLRPTDELPFGIIWLFGAGASIGNEVLASFPVGLSAGVDLRNEGILFRPYVTPRVALDVFTGPGDDLDLSAAVDLGLDLEFDPAWTIRFGAAFGDRDAISLGVTFAQLGR